MAGSFLVAHSPDAPVLHAGGAVGFSVGNACECVGGGCQCGFGVSTAGLTTMMERQTTFLREGERARFVGRLVAVGLLVATTVVTTGESLPLLKVGNEFYTNVMVTSFTATDVY